MAVAKRTLMTIRLDRELRTRLRAAAGRRAFTPSAAVRQALEVWLRAEEEGEQAQPFDAIADLVGCFKGPTDLSAPDRRPSRAGAGA